MVGRSRFGPVAKAPHTVFFGDFDHLVDQGLLFWPVIQKLHVVKQAVKFGVLVIGGVLAIAVSHRLGVGAVQQEQEVFSVRVIGQPAPEKDLHRALFHLVLEAVVVGGAHFELHANLGKLAHIPVQRRLVGAARGVDVKVQHQRLAGLGVAPIGVAGLGQQLFGLVQAAAHRFFVRAFAVDHRVKGGGSVFAVAKQRGRYRAGGSHALAAHEDGDVLFPVNGNGQRLAQLAVALGLLWRGALAHHRVHPVVAHVPGAGLYRRGQANALVLEFFFLFLVVAHGHDVARAHVQALNGRRVVIALHELGLQRHAFFLDVKHHLVHKGRGLAAVVQVAFFFVTRLAFAGIGLTPEVGVALQHVAAVLGELGQHEGASAHGPIIER